MFSVRQANEKDYLDIAIIHFTGWKAAHTGHLPESYVNAENILSAKIKMWKGILLHPKITVWIAYSNSDENKDKIVGFIGYFNIGASYEITTLYVLPEYHHSGIGTKLMDEVLKDISKTTQSPNLSFWISQQNVATINLAKEYGFKYSGETNEESYEDSQIVDIKMIKSLAS